MSGERRGIGAWLYDQGQSIDNMIIRQAQERAAAAREAGIGQIRGEMYANRAEDATRQQIQGTPGVSASAYKRAVMPSAKESNPVYDKAAAYQRDQAAAWATPVESLNQAMADSALARYGVVGSAALGGGMAMTAGAQKLMSLMGLLEQAGQVDSDRQAPLSS